MISSALAFGACSSDDSGDASDAGDEFGVLADAGLCNSFTKPGDPCAPISGTVCFPMCATGGCQCVQPAGGGTGVWQCQSDFSCFPEAGPLDDTGAPETGGDDASGDDASDDATVDAPVDAPLDADDAG